MRQRSTVKPAIRVRRARQSGFGFFFERERLCVLLAQAFDNVRGRTGDKALIAKLLVRGLKALVELGEFLGQAFALGGDVDLAFVENGDVECCCLNVCCCQ